MLKRIKKCILCASFSLAILLSLPMVASAASDLNKAADLVIQRPVLLVATAAGTLAYVVTYPLTASAGTSDNAKKDWVTTPAHNTFERPLGAPLQK